MKTNHLSLIAIALTTILSACSDSDNDSKTSDNDPKTIDTTVNLAAKVGTADFVSGTTYPDIGIGSTAGNQQFLINDFRMYLSNITLQTDTLEEVEVTLTEDGVWQYQNVVLLDFETIATPETNTQIIGSFTEPDSGTISKLCFDVGVPFELNHMNNADAPSPLNASGMMWIWQSGHKFIRIDGIGNPDGDAVGYNLHLGSTGCVSDAKTEAPTVACTYANLPHICLDNFDIDSNQVAIDLASLFSNTDITQATPDTAKGCMSGNNDPECQNLFPKMGLNFVYDDGVNTPQTYEAETQTMFSVETN